MQVILLHDVDNVGLRGEVVEVARGYARNFLLPRRLAEPANSGRIDALERRDSLRARHEAKTFEEGRELAERLAAVELRFDVKAGPTGALFGSVTSTNVVDELWSSEKIRVDRRKVALSEPIRRIGRYEIAIELFPDVEATLRTLVVPEGGELPPEEPAIEPAGADLAPLADEGADGGSGEAEAAAAGADEVLESVPEEPPAP